MTYPTHLRAALLLLVGPGCIVIDASDETCVPCEERGEVFGPDDGCPNECVNPADDSCWHAPGSCAHADEVEP